jgi:methylated-DNA-[protein]-cysteine S-methyltransferase
MTTVYTTFDCPLGELLLVGEHTETAGFALVSLSMPGQRTAPAGGASWGKEPALFADVLDQLREYFAGSRTHFAIEFSSTGTAFQRRVWSALEDIPFGTTTTYGALAARVGLERDRVQALAAAVAANPVLLVRPCHRVVGADGSMRGYAGGVERKVQLLTHEGALPPALFEPRSARSLATVR